MKYVIGICDASPLSFVKGAMGLEVPFVPFSTEERINPKLIMEEANSIIVVGLSASSPYKTDYHNDLKKLLETIALSYNLENYLTFTDTGPLNERALFVKSGLGFFGRNCNVYSEELGSFFHIGYIVTSNFLEETAKNLNLSLGDKCLECDLCIKHCPAKALSFSPVPTIDPFKCASYLTQKKGDLTDDEKKAIGKNVYGCVICQKVCPYNKGIAFYKDLDFDELKEITLMSKKEFKEKYFLTEMGWRGVSVIRRNALIVLGEE